MLKRIESGVTEYVDVLATLQRLVDVLRPFVVYGLNLTFWSEYIRRAEQDRFKLMKWSPIHLKVEIERAIRYMTSLEGYEKAFLHSAYLGNGIADAIDQIDDAGVEHLLLLELKAIRKVKEEIPLSELRGVFLTFINTVKGKKAAVYARRLAMMPKRRTTPRRNDAERSQRDRDLRNSMKTSGGKKNSKAA
jgi:hypothetical protein